MKPHRQLLRRLLPPAFLNRLNHISHIEDRLFDLEARCARLAEAALQQQTPQLFASIEPHEFRIFSQNGEDGILVWLLEQTGAPVKSFAEIGIEHGRECNTAVLGFVLGWSGVLFEADPLDVAAAQSLAARMLKDRPNRVDVRLARIDHDNIDALLGAGELGVLSIDVDSMDYWLWDAVRSANPRIVIMEYNASMGAELALTVPYSANFSAQSFHPSDYYHGASLAALEKLGRLKGYSLVAVCAAGVNAFFVRDDIRPASLPARTAAELFRSNAMRLRLHSQEEQWRLIEHLPYVRV